MSAMSELDRTDRLSSFEPRTLLQVGQLIAALPAVSFQGNDDLRKFGEVCCDLAIVHHKQAEQIELQKVMANV
tara:strand:- start:209 stop:427 length:219 start_codon:yes stop_codon:yes gene_type:complete